MSMPAEKLSEVGQQEADEFAALLNKSSNLVVEDTSDFAGLLDTAKFTQIQRAARMYASSNFVPEVFQGNIANCAVAIQMALRLNVDPMMLMQNMYIVHGKPGIEGKLAIALLNSRGPFTGPVQWRFEGQKESRKCTAYATHRITGELCDMQIDWTIVKGEGWESKSGSKWKTMPDQMFRYRTASWLARAYCPEVLLGLNTVDELYDIGNAGVAVPREVSMPRAKLKPVETIDKETGEINSPYHSGDPVGGHAGATIPDSAEQTTSEASQANEPPRDEQKEQSQKTAQKQPPHQVVTDMSPITEALQKVVRTKLGTNGKTEQDLGERWGYGIASIPLAEVNTVIDWICGKIE